VQEKIQTLLKMTGRPQGRTPRLQIVFKCAFRNFTISSGRIPSLSFQIMERSHGRLFKKADYARLHIAHGNSTLSQATQTKTQNKKRFFIKRDIK